MICWWLVNLILMEYAFGEFVLDLNRGELRGAGGPIPVEPRAFSLLIHMLENQGRLIDKEELITSVWGGRIVSDAAISTAIKAARRAIGDDGSSPAWLRTVRGRGFRFDGMISVNSSRAPSENLMSRGAPAAKVAADDTVSSMTPEAASMAIFDRPSVLVVGFDCANRDGPDFALALGLAQEVRLNLSHWRSFPVIGPEAVSHRSACEIDVRETGRKLGASYALSGSVRSIGDRVRIDATLSSIADGNSIWSRNFDGTLDNLFDFEEEVSRAIVAQIEPELSRANSQRLLQVRPNDLSAWQLLLAAGESQRRAGEAYGTPAANEEQKQLLQEALQKDPGMARAWAWLAKRYWRETIVGWANDREACISATLNASHRAMEINPANWEARCYRALALLFGRHEFVEAEFHARESVRLNPSDTTARHALGCVLENAGKTEEALEHLLAVFA